MNNENKIQGTKLKHELRTRNKINRVCTCQGYLVTPPTDKHIQHLSGTRRKGHICMVLDGRDHCNCAHL